MKKIIALTDYKGRFGSKHFDTPYRSGLDKDLLVKEFNKNDFQIEFVQMSVFLNQLIDFDIKDKIIYTSSEDVNYHYKSFIEDVVFHAENIGFDVLPDYKFLKANNNKVYMELLRNSTKNSALNSITSRYFGTLEEIESDIQNISFPCVIKKAEGASGAGVFKADNKKQLFEILKKINFTSSLRQDYKEFGRSIKHKGYIKESRYRKKFIIQNLIPNLKNDWKVYYFYDKLYVFYRPVFEHRDFRASGGGYDNYFYDENAQKPNGFFEFITAVISYFDVPHASLDIAFDGKNFHLIEIQFLYFGTAGIPYSNGHYENLNEQWHFVKSKLSIEEVYANSIVKYINSK